jgi:tetratricopeptide (TPR) repeat protein
MRSKAVGYQIVTTEGDNMISTFIVVAIVACAGWMAWRRWSDWRTPAGRLPSAGIPPETLAFESFTYGNTCLAAGKFADAIAAFQRARELDPKRLHVADRLAEAERRQAAASPPPAAVAS